MVDSVVTWAVDYKVDGFRFDLMGHHMVGDMVAVRAALDALTLEEHGVDGSQIYVYGEGWNFGEVANGARGVNATQLNVGGLGIGTFNDRLRDAARGGNPFGGQTEQGFITGLYTDPNATDQGPEGLQKVRLMQFSDQIRIGLAGNLADYSLLDMTGAQVMGSQVDYNGAPAGYTTAPVEHIVYVSAHDNETLFDIIQMKAPTMLPMEERVRMQNLGIDLVMYAQGVPFFHAGSDILRSKSGDRDSYDSGDWFNAIDWTYQDNNWGHGLPIADKNQGMWDILAPLLADPALQPTRTDMLRNHVHFLEALQIRQSTPLFHLTSAEAVSNQVRFHNTGAEQIPGLIVMSIQDANNIDPNLDVIVVLFNQTPESIDFNIAALTNFGMQLHPVQQVSADARMQKAAFNAGTFTVPGRTTAVFVDGDVPVSNTALANIQALGETIAAAESADTTATEETDATIEVTEPETTDEATEEQTEAEVAATDAGVGTLLGILTIAVAIAIVVPVLVGAPFILGLVVLGNKDD